jgi:lysozyme
MTSPICIDISHWQDYPNFDEVYASGVKGMIHKATEGTSYVDPNRAENCSNAVNAGIAIATYFWIKPGDGRAQAEFYLSTIDPVQGERVVVDYEEDGCTLTMLKDAVQALMDYKKGLKITVYSGHLLKEQLGSKCDDFLRANTDLWLAQYTDGTPTWPTATYPQWALWQYSETGTIPGIDDAYVDLNNYNGVTESFLKWISPTSAPPSPKPRPPKPPSDQDVKVAVTAPQNVNVIVTVNGVTTRRRPGMRKAKSMDLAHRRY